MAAPAKIAQLRSGMPVAGWLFKAAPGVWDVERALMDGVEIDSWGMADTYRRRLLAAGQPCGIWLTRGWSRPSGVLALGELCSAAYEDAVEDDGRWVGGPPVDQVQFRVDLRLRVLDQVIALDELRADARFRSAEVIRAPRVSSPIALAPSEWAAVLDRS